MMYKRPVLPPWGKWKWAKVGDGQFLRAPPGRPATGAVHHPPHPSTPFCSLASGTFCERENRAHQTRASQSSTFTRPFPRDEQEHLQTFLLQNCFAVNLSEMICKLTVFCYVGKVKPTSSYL